MSTQPIDPRRAYAEGFTVSRPYHSEGATVWYVLDPEGDPVDSARSREEAERIRDEIRARFAAEVPE